MRKNILAQRLSAMALAWLTALGMQAQQVEFFTPSIVHITHAPQGKNVEKKASLVVTAQPQKVSVNVKKQGDATIYRTSALTVTVQGGKVTFADNKGRVLTQEGGASFKPITSGPDQGSYRVGQQFSVEAQEGIYGVGMLQNTKMSQRGENRRMEQNNLEDYAHFYQSLKGYGLYWDNYSPTHLRTPEKDQAGSIALESEVGQQVDYYLLYGGNADEVVRQMRHLTGHVPMLPLWTYGFHQSRERYKSQDELLGVVRRYREEMIPLDGIIQDWQYWGSNYTWNAMEFNIEEYGQAQRMIDEVHQRGAHMSISIWASFGPQTKQFQELKDKNLLFSFETWPQSGLTFWPPRMDYPSGVRVYKPYSQEALDIYWKYLSHMHKMGIDAWWMDSTDPDHHSYKDSDLDEMTAMGSYRSVRNIFPYMTVGGVYDHQRAVDSTKRVFILTRSYFAGQQRTGANTWSGDIQSTWESFRAQVPLCLNYTLTGNPNVNTDIGGFFCGRWNTRGSNSAMNNPEFRELYVRWIQFGLWNPMMRSHGADAWREIYLYGKPGEPVYDALKSAVKERYRLMPTIYSQAWQVSKNDDSYMRALFMDYPEDPRTWDMNSQFMFGHNILVCPVLRPLKEGEDYNVYLPKEKGWWDYWTDEYITTTGQDVDTHPTLAHSPVYVRPGSILCFGPDVQYTSEKPWDELTVKVYPGNNATFTLYEDEGDNYNYEKGQYTEIPMTWNDKARTLTIGARRGHYQGMIASRTFTVQLPGGKAKTVKYNGKAVSVKM